MTAGEPIVALDTGQLRGLREDGVAVFRGVPYAQPPVGARRFRPPVAGAPWDGIRDAHAFGSIAHQFPNDLEELQGRLTASR
jgi:para-nitrobenzyl esterase